MPVFEPVTAVVRGLELLRTVNQMGQATVTQLHHATGLHKATVLRMVETLVHAGYIARLPNTTAYVATGKCLQLSAGFQMEDSLNQIASPILKEFRRKLGWPSNFAIFDYDAMIISLVSYEFGMLSLSFRPGTRVPMLASSVGRAYLAFSSDRKRDQILSRLSYSENPYDRIATDRPACIAMLDRIRSDGFALGGENYLKELYDCRIWVIGVPILVQAEAVAAVNFIFLRNAFTLEEGLRNFLLPLQQVAATIGAEIERDYGGIAGPGRDEALRTQPAAL